MTMIAITMRMMRHSYPGGTQEVRDALAQDWWSFLNRALPGVPVLPLPNIGREAVALAQALPVSGLILTGGDDWGLFPRRDATEEALFRWAERQALPVLGVCRGAQIINRFMGGHTGTGFGTKHAGARHALHVVPRAREPQLSTAPLEVNSWHNGGIRQDDLAPGLSPWAFAPDGSVEAFCSAEGGITGIMWHPEREPTAQAHDIHLFQVLNRGKA